MIPIEAVHVENKKVTCNGDGHSNSSLHPLVYLNMGEKNHIHCPYCNRYFTTNKLNTFKTPNIKSTKDE